MQMITEVLTGKCEGFLKPVIDDCKSCSHGGKERDLYETWIPVNCDF